MEAAERFKDFRYGDFKKAVAQAVLDELTPFKARYEEIIASGSYKEVLREGAKKASILANKTLHKVQKAVGLFEEDE
jgi:tryptophanyl-tRNA synthetase